jgi:anaerobic dimethyl sulfoxide reductase subunit B (iron-sulfur subunit)
MAKQLAFYFDASACADCKACQVACQDKNNLPAQILWRRVFQYNGGGWLPEGRIKDVYRANNVFSYSISTACMHCQEPICVDICPAAAVEKRADGLIMLDQDKCIGCRYCEWACPYGAPVFDHTRNVMTKCTFCEDLLAKGENPACVDACPMRALDFGELDELRAKYGDLADIEPLPSAEITKPAYVFDPHQHTIRGGMGRGEIANLPEEV